MRSRFILFCLCIFTIQGFSQQSYQEKVQNYVARFKDIAIAEQQRTGIPASVKLAQGIFETAAGESELCTKANNHFGIKCKSNWSGPTYNYTDDAPNECFRSYPDEIQSYKDHSDFLLKNKRYQALFKLSVTDYAAWAYGLKTCGYATDPNYAKRLIKTIEEYRLQQYTYQAMENPTNNGVLLASADPKSVPEVPEPSVQKQATIEESKEQPTELTAAKNTQVVADYYQLTTKNGKKGFYAKKGDLLLGFAIKNRVRYGKLLELNDLPDAPLEADMFIYLERKGKTGVNEMHVVKNGETLLQISQHEGILLSELQELNQLSKGEEPAVGTVLQLQKRVETKPSLEVAPGLSDETQSKNAEAGNTTKPTVKSTSGEEWVVIPQTEQTVDPMKDRGYVPERVSDQVSINIANEPAIEEVMAKEQPAAEEKVDLSKEEGMEEVVIAPATPAIEEQAVEVDKELSPLDKLKAYMDKTVYAQKETYEPQQSKPANEGYTTRPARNYNAPNGNNQSSSTSHTDNKTQHKFHKVQRGDTAFSIAKKYGITISQLKKWNKLSSSNVQLGARLRVVAP